jgi:hypothetical protein
MLAALTRVPVAAILVAMVPTIAAEAADPPPQGRQSDSDFAASYASFHVSNVSATSQEVSCYTPELEYDGALPPNQGYLDGGMSDCNAKRPPAKTSAPIPRRTSLTRRSGSRTTPNWTCASIPPTSSI